MASDIEETIEAGSLSTITALASNPPQHLGIPVRSIGSPLVLYIARVPGSRDVFLTPLKPRDKVVTAEDVQSSLYFVHVNEDFDDQVLQQPPKPSSVNTNASDLPYSEESAVSRKPVLPPRPEPPTTPPYPAHEQAPAHASLNQPKLQQVPRKPVNPNNAYYGSDFLEKPTSPVTTRRPLPTPPEEQPSHLSPNDDNNMRFSRHSGDFDDPNPYFRRYSEDANARRKESFHVPKLEAGSLTLIRRDPASGEQWNVASIHDPPVQEVSSSALLYPSSAIRTKRGGVPLYLDITSPGYLQFINEGRPVSRTSTSTGSSDTEPAPDGTFRRRLYMPGSRYGEHGYGHGRHGSDDSGIDMRRTMRKGQPTETQDGNPKWDRRGRGYSFKSPWEGQCEFTTGATGKSLKCRQTCGQQGAVDMSELRFNLPTSTKNMHQQSSEKRASVFSRHSRIMSSKDGENDPTPSVIINDDGTVDLTLGQEKAGGGFGGKQAKLGKLIVSQEGMKMLDLLVAANVGLWWRAYERA
ncbi:hypothetical protein KC354_g15790 [Hortaea werneckii]|nr:hypothetical protein KC354_g15790 [Hortaea werneckii]